MKRLLTYLIVLIIVAAGCDDEIINKEESYTKVMIEKDFSFESLRDGGDALFDTIYNRFDCYIESKTFTDSSLTVDIKFKDAGCQEFMGDYKVSNDTLYFEFETTNDVACSSISFYHYRLQLNNFKQEINHIILHQYREWDESSEKLIN